MVEIGVVKLDNSRKRRSRRESKKGKPASEIQDATELHADSLHFAGELLIVTVHGWPVLIVRMARDHHLTRSPQHCGTGVGSVVK